MPTDQPDRQAMHIVGCIVWCAPAHCRAVARRLPGLGAEAHVTGPGGQIVITLEAPLDDLITERLAAIQSLEGVLHITMIYHHIDRDDTDGGQP